MKSPVGRRTRKQDLMAYQREQPLNNVTATEQELSRLKAQFNTLIEALEDVVSVLRSSGSDEIKLVRIEDVLSSAVSDAARLD